MEFEEMQIIWNTQNDEKLYAINETALHAQIKRKAQSIDRKLTFIEYMMIGVNLVVGIVLIVETLADNEQALQFIFPALYLGYSCYALYRRLARQKEVVRFDETMLGELDKALGQTDYLIQQSWSMIQWYLLPLLIAFSIFAFFNAKLVWAAAMMFVLLPATYFGTRWEINKFYLPKKRSLEALREKLLNYQPNES
jgi:hypothetical protein